MGEHINIATLVWGTILTIVGAWFFGVGVGWWELAFFDLRYALPAVVILVGTGLLLGSLASDRR